MSCKKPILMLIDGVSRKLVEDANCGLYIEPENILLGVMWSGVARHHFYLEENVNKLKARYPGGAFDPYFSENRKEGDL